MAQNNINNDKKMKFRCFGFKNCFFIFFLLIFILITPGLAAQYKIKTVVIDAGHGGKDPGAMTKKSKEKNITLAIALKLGDYIEKNIKGVKVIYTREKDEFVELFKRAEIANKNKADVFISIHVNSNTNPKPYGTSTYVMGLHKSEDNLEVAKLENAVILKEEGYKENYKGFDPNSPESYIVLNLLQDAHLEQSLNLAAKVQNQFRERAGRKDIGVKQAGLVVLWNATMPAILVETGFMSNPAEEKYLISDEGQSIIASAIYRAFKEYKNEIESLSKNYTNSQNKSTQQINGDQKTGSIVFRIQIKSSVDKIPKGSSLLFGFEDVKEYKFKGIYKYYVGETSDFSEITKMQGEIRKKVPDAFVVAFKNDERITIKEALEERENKK
ncbi:MAG: N-acetylmuramoyl-L-alanine amidase [Bacteroidales bacterium]